MSNLMSGDFQACTSYRMPIEHDEAVCAGCGHLADDHEPVGATVTALRAPNRHPSAFRPTRKAS